MGHDEIAAIMEAINALPEDEYYDEVAKNLMSAITLIKTHVLDEDDPEAID